MGEHLLLVGMGGRWASQTPLAWPLRRPCREAVPDVPRITSMSGQDPYPLRTGPYPLLLTPWWQIRPNLVVKMHRKGGPWFGVACHFGLSCIPLRVQGLALAVQPLSLRVV